MLISFSYLGTFSLSPKVTRSYRKKKDRKKKSAVKVVQLLVIRLAELSVNKI